MPGVIRDDTRAVSLVKEAALVPHPGCSLAQRIFESIEPAAEFVLIGEASHGTEDFYRQRAEVTKLLIQERGFSAVVLEADFPDAFRVNQFVRGMGQDADADEALSDFLRFPTWMWRNTAVRDFVAWLRGHNDRQKDMHMGGGGAGDKEGAMLRTVGVYGMDVYSLHSSALRVVEFLRGVDPKAADRASKRYHCFDKYGVDTMAYGIATGLGGQPSCAEAALANLRDVIRHNAEYVAKADGFLGEELAFQAACNAAVVAGAEMYYRNMFFGDELTWNIRDGHFADTVSMIHGHIFRRLARLGPDAPAAKLVVWAHNSHLGDASATDMGQRRGEVNVGQLLRERYGRDKVFNIGFTTHTGTVAAADNWEKPAQRKAVRKSMPGSYEHLLHKAQIGKFALPLKHGSEELQEALAGPLLERAIGVIYRPDTERQSHYFFAELPAQFDLVVHIDHTKAVTPLDTPKHPSWEAEVEATEDFPETYPFGV